MLIPTLFSQITMAYGAGVLTEEALKSGVECTYPYHILFRLHASLSPCPFHTLSHATHSLHLLSMLLCLPSPIIVENSISNPASRSG